MPNLLRGLVTKTGAMSKTITVTVAQQFEHPIYLKRVHRTKKFLVHDETNQAAQGDKVTIIHTKPWSARKTFALHSIDKKQELVQETRSTEKTETELR